MQEWSEQTGYCRRIYSAPVIAQSSRVLFCSAESGPRMIRSAWRFCPDESACRAIRLRRNLHFLTMSAGKEHFTPSRHDHSSEEGNKGLNLADIIPAKPRDWPDNKIKFLAILEGGFRPPKPANNLNLKLLPHLRPLLIDLLSHSATYIFWRLCCQPSAQPEDRFCVSSVSPIQLTVADRSGLPVKNCCYLTGASNASNWYRLRGDRSEVISWNRCCV